MPSSRYPSCAGVMVTHSIPGGGYANRPRSSRFANRHMPLKMSIMPSDVTQRSDAKVLLSLNLV
jgi:hypothetical protein